MDGLARALDRHAEEIFITLSPEQQRIAEVLFRCLSERGRSNLKTGPRDTRRPTSVQRIAEVAAVSVAQVDEVVNIFRRPALSILMSTGK